MYRLRRWPNGSRNFTGSILDVQFAIWCINLWPISEVKQRDSYGMDASDPDCQLDLAEDYSDFLPPEAKTEATAMRFAGYWNMTTDGVLDMEYVMFYRRSMIHRALTLRKPEYTKDDWMMERTTSKFRKTRLRHRRGRRNDG